MAENNHSQEHEPKNAGQMAECEQELQDCKNQLDKSKELYAYLNAEFENYKKRMEKQRAQWIDSAQTVVLSSILPIVDNFERALEQVKLQELPREMVSYLTGFELIAKELQKFLKANNLEEITQNTQFDPELHEAIMQVDNPEYASGHIVSVLRKGYLHKGQVIRPAQVSVAQ